MNRKLWLAGLTLVLAGCASAPQPGRIAPKSTEPIQKGWSDLSAGELARTYGEPSFVRKEADSEIWRYDVGACRIFFFLYPGERSPTVRHVESIPSGGDQPIERNCLNAFKLRLKKN
jgi:hypothetical protein